MNKKLQEKLSNIISIPLEQYKQTIQPWHHDTLFRRVYTDILYIDN
jgi:hypothetical protein